MPTERLSRQVAFLLEADGLKRVLRRNPLTDNSRLENSAEHSWHLALAAVALVEYAPEGVDLVRVLHLVAIHDLVEIDAGDTFAYDDAGHETKVARELAAAERIFGLLPPDQAAEFRQCWNEFEARETPDARYANALDRLQPLLQNMKAGGGSWHAPEVTRAKVLRRMAPVADALPAVWPLVVEIIEQACAAGTLAAGDDDTGDDVRPPSAVNSQN